MRPGPGQLKLRAISPAAVRERQNRLIADGLSSARTRHARNVLGSMLKMAVTDVFIVRNPVERVEGPKLKARRQRYLTVA